MTNLLAYQTTYSVGSEDAARLALTTNLIDPDLEDQNELSVAYAIYEKVTASDYSQGSTSEKLSDSARSLLINKAIAIFLKFDLVSPFGYGNAEISGVTW